MSVVESFIEVSLPDSDSFLKIKETLTRIGIPVEYRRRPNKLWQSVHILHKQGKYYIVHYKQLFELDGRSSTFSEEDRARLNTITGLLQEWGLLSVIDKEMIKAPKAPLNQIKIVSFKDKKDWQLCQKYNIGKTKA